MTRTHQPSHLDIVSGMLRAGSTQAEIAVHFGVCRMTISKWKLSMPEYAEERRQEEDLRARIEASGLRRETVYSRLRRGCDVETALSKSTLPKPMSPMRKRAKELAAHPDCTVSAKCLYARLVRGWSEEEAMLCAKGVW